MTKHQGGNAQYHCPMAGAFLSPTIYLPIDLAIWRDYIKTGSMTASLISMLISTIKTLYTILSCGIRLTTHFMNVFSPSVRLHSASYVGLRIRGGCGKLLRYRDMLMLMTQRASTRCVPADSVLLASSEKY